VRLDAGAGDAVGGGARRLTRWPGAWSGPPHRLMGAAADASDARSATPSAERPRSLWVIGSTAASFAAAAPILRQMRERFPRLRVICSPREAALAAWLRAHDAATAIVAPPPGSRWRVAGVLRRRNARLVLLLDGVASAEAALLRAARRRHLPIVVLASSAWRRDGGAASLSDLVECFVATDAGGAAALRAAGVDAARIVAPADDASAIPAAVASLSALLRRDVKALRSEHNVARRAVERLAVAAVDRPGCRWLIGRRAARIATLEQLARHLGHPHTILCLGNGPSSEDPRLRELDYDALFRVNHLWQARAVLTDPVVVFTGTAETVRRVPSALIATSLIRHEGRLVLTGLLRRGARPFRFVTAERLGILVPQPDWHGMSPTNGAYMLATAVALRPARLIIAGIDLFRHPAGAYPGDATTPNAYTPRHEAEFDERVILSLLHAYQGDLVIIGDVLRERWEAGAQPSPL